MDEETWSLLESTVEYENPWYTGGYDRVRQPDGTEKKYYWASLPPAVVIVARHGTSILFIEQYRPILRETHLELPAGIVEQGESMEQAGARELREETGYRAGRVECLQEYQVATGVLRHRRGVVYAGDLTEGTPEQDSNEFVSLHPVPVNNAIDVARRSPANDSSMTALLLAKEENLI